MEQKKRELLRERIKKKKHQNCETKPLDRDNESIQEKKKKQGQDTTLHWIPLVGYCRIWTVIATLL